MNAFIKNKTFFIGSIVILLIILSWLTIYKLKQNNISLAYLTSNQTTDATTTMPTLFQYGEIINSCGPYFSGECVNMRSGPGIEYPSVVKLRNNIVLKLGEKVTANGEGWYKIIFDEWLRYPERVKGDLFVSAKFIKPFLDEGDKKLESDVVSSSTKLIIIDRSSQTISAYDGEVLFMKEKISTGIELTPTPRGTFSIYRKTPSRYMQGPIVGISEKEYDLPGVPWNLYFTAEGAVIHGAYWHDKFGQPWSNGCVNLSPENAKKLYEWAEIDTKVIVQD